MAREAQPANLDDRAAVHDHSQTGGARPFRGSVVHNAKLHPHGARV
jgi:hypothetical protein